MTIDELAERDRLDRIHVLQGAIAGQIRSIAHHQTIRANCDVGLANLARLKAELEDLEGSRHDS